jgi:tRNA modification GTPase
MDTIFALASARGKAGIAVIRLSGPQAHAATRALAGTLPPLRQGGLRKLRWAGEVLDEALVLTFAANASFTGEQSAELQVHGSIAVVTAVLRALADQPGLRIAQAGEFTRRALENECLDLTQVEGLADLIDAETEAQRKQALRVLSGALGQRVGLWRANLTRAAALIEVTIDFADEDVPYDVAPEVIALVTNQLAALRLELVGATAAERIRDGFEIAIVGRPNVGKSTLLNALAGRDAAITSEIAGTTRDIIEVRMDLAGLPVTLLDTAGLRAGLDPVEQLGIARTITRAAQADLRVFILADPNETLPLPPAPDDITLLAKADLFPGRPGGISGRTGEGVDALIAAITGRLSGRAASAGLLIRERQRNALMAAEVALESALRELQRQHPAAEIVAVELRSAMRWLDELIGKIDVEDLLGEIFSKFCIGK